MEIEHHLSSLIVRITWHLIRAPNRFNESSTNSSKLRGPPQSFGRQAGDMNFHIQGPQVLSATVQNLATTLAWILVFVQFWLLSSQ
jgi:hypothetical protein